MPKLPPPLIPLHLSPPFGKGRSGGIFPPVPPSDLLPFAKQPALNMSKGEAGWDFSPGVPLPVLFPLIFHPFYLPYQTTKKPSSRFKLKLALLFFTVGWQLLSSTFQPYLKPTPLPEKIISLLLIHVSLKMS
jgi:hypothetical protein